MTIQDYIRDQVFSRRVQEHSCLVIYDPVRRYREIALAMATDLCRVIDVSKSVVEQREVANEVFADLVEGRIHQLVKTEPSDSGRFRQSAGIVTPHRRPLLAGFPTFPEAYAPWYSGRFRQLSS